MTRAPSGLPFDDIRNLLDGMPAGDDAAGQAARARNEALAKPVGSLGRLEELTEWLARWQANPAPSVERPVIAVFAANHGIAERGLTPEPQSFTRIMVEALAAGGAAVNQLALAANAGLKVFDLALDMPTPDICTGDALSEKDCAATMAFGMESIASGADLLCVAALGAGNDVIASALACALFGGAPSDWCESANGQEAVASALAFHGDALRDPLEALRRVGGRELAAIAGAIAAARYQRIPVVLDGFVACAAAGVLHKYDPSALDHCVAAHRRGDGVHDRLLAALGKKPLLDLDIGLGDGSASALAVQLLKSSVALQQGMATSEQAGFVSPPQPNRH